MWIEVEGLRKITEELRILMALADFQTRPFKMQFRNITP
jgi:hypothetical protein